MYCILSPCAAVTASQRCFSHGSCFPTGETGLQIAEHLVDWQHQSTGTPARMAHVAPIHSFGIINAPQANLLRIDVVAKSVWQQVLAQEEVPGAHQTALPRGAYGNQSFGVWGGDQRHEVPVWRRAQFHHRLLHACSGVRHFLSVPLHGRIRRVHGCHHSSGEALTLSHLIHCTGELAHSHVVLPELANSLWLSAS